MPKINPKSSSPSADVRIYSVADYVGRFVADATSKQGDTADLTFRGRGGADIVVDGLKPADLTRLSELCSYLAGKMAEPALEPA